jgi:putative membrane protein
MTIEDIPTLNASLNATATVLLVTGFVLIRNKRIAAHRACMTTAFVVSALFLVGYLGHKYLRWQAGDAVNSTINATGAIKTFYLVMLATHVVLAMVILPLVLRTFVLARRGDFTRHRIWARWTFPLWLYVSVTGVLVYFFLYRWFPAVPAPA